MIPEIKDLVNQTQVVLGDVSVTINSLKFCEIEGCVGSTASISLPELRNIELRNTLDKMGTVCQWSARVDLTKQFKSSESWMDSLRQSHAFICKAVGLIIENRKKMDLLLHSEGCEFVALDKLLK